MRLNRGIGSRIAAHLRTPFRYGGIEGRRRMDDAHQPATAAATSRRGLSRRHRTIILGMVAAACAPAGLAGTDPGRQPGLERGYTSQAQADADLLNFAETHPQCQLWTNWQKMCSRTGPNGKAHCATTRQNDVRPSAPFCAGDQNGPRRPGAGDSPAEIASSLRYCRSPSAPSDGRAGEDGSCAYDPQRPFSGRDLRDREHPWCSAWYEAGKMQPASEARRAPNGLYCAARNIPDWCSFADGLGRGPDLETIRRIRKNEPAPDLVVGTLPDPDAMPVRGVFCRRRGEA